MAGRLEGEWKSSSSSHSSSGRSSSLPACGVSGAEGQMARGDAESLGPSKAQQASTASETAIASGSCQQKATTIQTQTAFHMRSFNSFVSTAMSILVARCKSPQFLCPRDKRHRRWQFPHGLPCFEAWRFLVECARSHGPRLHEHKR